MVNAQLLSWALLATSPGQESQSRRKRVVYELRKRGLNELIRRGLTSSKRMTVE
jgi:hypothetical protein